MMEEFDMDVPRRPSKKRYLPWVFLPTTILFLLLWLSESQWGEGVLRKKYVGESCEWSLVSSNSCSEGLYCLNKVCTLPTCNCEGLCPETTPCPELRPVVASTVTYFDYNEKPNHWLDPGPPGFYNIQFALSYGACKEVCARETRCKGIAYRGEAEMCCLMERFYMPFVGNNTWNSAIKIFFT